MKKILEMYAFVSQDKDGEGIIGMKGPDGNWVPLVGAEMDRIESLKMIARKISKATDMKIRLIKFSKREDLGEI